jgi:hypothetical protein
LRFSSATRPSPRWVRSAHGRVVVVVVVVVVVAVAVAVAAAAAVIAVDRGLGFTSDSEILPVFSRR